MESSSFEDKESQPMEEGDDSDLSNTRPPLPADSDDDAMGGSGDESFGGSGEGSWRIGTSDENSSFLDEFESDVYSFSGDEFETPKTLEELVNYQQQWKDRLALEQASSHTLNESSPPRPSSPVDVVKTFGRSVNGSSLRNLNYQEPSEQKYDDLDQDGQRMFPDEMELSSNPGELENDADSSSQAKDENFHGNPDLILTGSTSSSAEEANFADEEIEISESESEAAGYSRKPNRKRKLNSNLSERPNLCENCGETAASGYMFCLPCFKIGAHTHRVISGPRAERPKIPKTEESDDIDVIGPSDESAGEDTVDGPVIIIRSHPQPKSVPPTSHIDMNTAFMIDEDNQALTRLHPTFLPGNLTIAELMTPPNSQEDDLVLPHPPCLLSSS